MKEIEEYRDFINKIKEEEEQAKTQFNIFTALHKERDEKRLHSRFIAYLLNPNSKHQKGNVFLNAFLEKTKISFRTTDCNIEVKPSEINHWAEKEYIDILIENGEQAIIIENKIDASDSNHDRKNGQHEIQLVGYYENVKKKYNDDKISVVYLTIDRHEPERIDEIKKEIPQEIKCIEYRTEIRNWLIECANQTKDDAFLNKIILQYKDVTEKISNDVEKAKELKKRINKNLIIALNYKEETEKLELFNHVKWHTIDDFWNELTGELDELNKNYQVDKDDHFVNKITKVAHNKRNISIGISFKTKNNERLYIANDSQGFTLGYWTTEGKRKYGFFSDNRLKKINFNDFSNEETFKMISEEGRKNTINAILNEIEKFPTLCNTLAVEL